MLPRGHFLSLASMILFAKKLASIPTYIKRKFSFLWKVRAIFYDDNDDDIKKIKFPFKHIFKTMRMCECVFMKRVFMDKFISTPLCAMSAEWENCRNKKREVMVSENGGNGSEIVMTRGNLEFSREEAKKVFVKLYLFFVLSSTLSFMRIKNLRTIFFICLFLNRIFSSQFLFIEYFS